MVSATKVKHYGKKILIDIASIIIFLAILYFCAQGVTMIYKGYYDTGKLAPDVFQAAATQFTAAIGLVYTLQLTRKHYTPAVPDDSKGG